MPDNVGYSAGAGTKIASREVSYSGETAQSQAVGIVTFSGDDDAKIAVDVDSVNPLPVSVYGELIEAIEAMRFAVNQLGKSIGFALPNTSGQPIMEVRQATAANCQVTATIASGTVTTVSSVTAVAALTNQTQIGGIVANDQIPALMHLQADSLRRNILVT